VATCGKQWAQEKTVVTFGDPRSRSHWPEQREDREQFVSGRRETRRRSMNDPRRAYGFLSVAWLAPILYHCQDRGFSRKHPRSCSMGRCVVFGRLQKKPHANKEEPHAKTQGRKERNGKGRLWLTTSRKGRLVGDGRKTDTPTWILYLFASWREVFLYFLRRCVFAWGPQFSEYAARRNRFMMALPTPISGTGST